MNATVRALVAAVVQAGDPADAVAKARFFQALPGGYAEGDVFVGVRVPVLRTIARQWRARVEPEDLEEILDDGRHEARLLGGLLLVELYRKGDEGRRAEVVDIVLRTDGLDNWDLVDTVAPYTLGPWLLARPGERILLDELAADTSVWRRRLAVVSTFALIREGEYDDVLRLSAALLDDPHDLIHKATGWMLREVGRRSRPDLDAFLDRHAAVMPRTMLRYALEKHPASERTHYLSRRTN